MFLVPEGHDITEIKKAKDLAVEHEKAILLAGMSAGIAHEINNPLAVIINSVQNIHRRIYDNLDDNIRISEELKLDLEKMRRYLEKNKIEKYLKNIKASVVRGMDVVRNMLNFSRIQEKNKSIIYISELIDLSIFFAKNDISIKNEMNVDEVEIDVKIGALTKKLYGFESELQQVFVNLLKNSLFAINEKMKKKPKMKPLINISVIEEKEYINIKIRDNGIGMTYEVKESIFDSFFTTKQTKEGNGLGLFIINYIIKNHHGGNILVDSQLGKWTEFTLKLPAS